MSQKDIVAKLTEALGGPVKSECQVVYVLAEIRKLLQRDKIGGDFKSLKFCCDWAAHADLSWAPVQDFVKKIDVRFGKLSSKEDQEVDAADLAEILYLAPFRLQLQNCLQRYKVPTQLFDNEESWREFLRLYSLVIQDCPLTCQGEGKNLDEAVVTKAEEVGVPSERAFETKWELRLKGKTVRVLYLHSDGTLRTEPR